MLAAIVGAHQHVVSSVLLLVVVRVEHKTQKTQKAGRWTICTT
jgi:hypothetical protein